MSFYFQVVVDFFFLLLFYFIWSIFLCLVCHSYGSKKHNKCVLRKIERRQRRCFLSTLFVLLHGFTQSVSRNHIKTLIHRNELEKIDPHNCKQKHRWIYGNGRKEEMGKKPNGDRIYSKYFGCRGENDAIWGWWKYNKTYTTNKRTNGHFIFQYTNLNSQSICSVPLPNVFVCVCENNHWICVSSICTSNGSCTK